MRRGHPGAGVWRGEHRPFRPRGSGNQNFRPARPFGLLDPPRFASPGPGPRQYRGPRPFIPHLGRPDSVLQPDIHDRNKYRLNNLTRSQGRGYHNQGQKQSYHHSRQNIDHDNSYNESNYYQNQYHVNNMGDVDHRHQSQMMQWTNPPDFDNNKQYYDDHRSPQKTPRHYDMGDDLPDYTGHRPPASDHYSSTTGPNNNNSQYSHSVDDTVDIIRKRLLNRDKQQNFDSSIDTQSNVLQDEDLRKNTTENYQSALQAQPVRKRVQRQKQDIKMNCDQMKNKIVNQLFKMDKTKIHKLMDDPSSSNKFEYAISNLITEGQNSLNRHLRSAAEKSLSSSSTSFIQDDTNTIYEDTFMKQMQGVLDPQDTILLEDIKPMVMAELCRVLQLDEYPFEMMMEQNIQHQGTQDHNTYDQGVQNYDNEFINSQYVDNGQYYDQFSEDISYHENNSTVVRSNNTEIIPTDINEPYYESEKDSNFESKPLFARRRVNKVHDNDIRNSPEYRQSRPSIDRSFGYLPEQRITNSPKKEISETQSIPLFNTNLDEQSDDDDPFAELDNQYHVAVDHNFIGNASRAASPAFSYTSNSRSPSERYEQNSDAEIPTPTTSNKIKNKVDLKQNVTQNVSVKLNQLTSTCNKSKTDQKVKPSTEMKKDHGHVLEKENFTAVSSHHVSISHEESSKKKEMTKKPDKHESSASAKSVLQSNTRKRSTDQKPSHRKEKRKKRSQSECQEASKSIMNMFYMSENSKESNNKDSSKSNKKSVSVMKTYSEKYVKRKQTPKKAKEKELEVSKTDEMKKLSINTPSHSNVSPKDNSLDETASKSDAKTKLKPIDIFGAQPSKKGTPHHAHRNTATTPQIESPNDNKPKLIAPVTTSFARKLSKRHTGTQVVLKVRSKECQTEKLKRVPKETQTDPVTIKTKTVATNPLERMKEIDMEIQLLLQEKFQLYNSLETKAATVPMDTIPSLSMRVFKVNTEQVEEANDDSEDAIVDDFANMPAEELEQIALESMDDEKTNSPKAKIPGGPRKNVPAISPKKTRRFKAMQKTMTPVKPVPKQSKKRVKSPNISLIEQIITDDRPIEDIISLDDLETTPIKSKKIRRPPKKKYSKNFDKKKSSNFLDKISQYNIKECCVVLDRIDINQYLRNKECMSTNFMYEEANVSMSPPDISETKEELPMYISENQVEIQSEEPSMEQVVEEVVNELQFDMLDVSEDIVIGDTCEVKTIDKVKETISEEIILDNSQSSMEDGTIETAGNENECKMYDYSNENMRRDAITVTGNADAVLAIECIDNDFIAACLDGNVYHFSGDGQLLNTLRGTNQAVTCLTIVREKYGTTVYTGSLDSRMRYYDLESGMEKGPECNVLSPIQTMDRAWDTIFVGTRTGFVLQFECKNNMVIPVSTVKFSEQSILALRAMKEGPRKVLLVAARSENVVTVKDAQTGLLLRTLQGPKMTVYTLLYEDGKVYCGTSSHNIHIFDYTSGGHLGSHEGGKGAVCLRASGGLVFAGCYDGCVYVYREGEPRPRAQLRGPGLMLLSLAIQGTKIIAGYKDRGLYIWKMPLAIVQDMIL